MKCHVTDDNKLYEDMDQNLSQYHPLHVRKYLSLDRLKALTQKLRQFYFNGGKVDKTKLKGFSDVSVSYWKLQLTAIFYHLNLNSLHEGNFMASSCVITWLMQCIPTLLVVIDLSRVCHCFFSGFLVLHYNSNQWNLHEEFISLHGTWNHAHIKYIQGQTIKPMNSCYKIGYVSYC